MLLMCVCQGHGKTNCSSSLSTPTLNVGCGSTLWSRKISFVCVNNMLKYTGSCYHVDIKFIIVLAIILFV